MKRMKKPLSLLIALLLVCGMFFTAPASFSAEHELMTAGTFTLETFDGYDPGELTYYYSDSYFNASGKEADPSLRTMSAALVFTICGTSSTPEQTYSPILDNIGFTDIAAYDMDHTAMDSMGVVLAHKRIGGSDVVAVALRGDGYGVEMAANLIAGPEGDIKAFADAEALVESRVKAYLAEHGITSAKYWVVGYSRSGAVANLFGCALNRDPAAFCTTQDDIYVYTMDAPLSSADDTVYENIHNIIDRRDPVTYVYPAAWSLYNNGVAEYIGSEDDLVTIKYFSVFSESFAEDGGRVRAADFLTDFIDFLCSQVSRETYCEKLQTPVSQVAEIYFSLSMSGRDRLTAYFTQVGEELQQDKNLLPILLAAFSDPTSETSVDSVTNLFIRYMDQVADEVGQPLDDASYDTVKAAVRPAVEVLLPVVSKDFSSMYDYQDGTAPEPSPLYHFMTFASAFPDLIQHHFNYRIFDELRKQDPNYIRKTVMLGDVDGDGKVDIFDASAIQKSLSGTSGYPKYDAMDRDDPQFLVADVDRDGKIDIFDASLIQRFIAGDSDAKALGVGGLIA